MAKSSAMDLVMKFEKFDGKGNFTLWQTRMKALLVAQGLQKALLGKEKKPADMKDDEWEEMDLKALSIIQLCLADDVMFNVITVKTTAEMWSKLQGLYMTKSLSSKLYWKKQLYGLRMSEGNSITDHLNSFNRICSEILGIGESLKEEDKAMILLMSLPSSYDHMVTSLMIGKETLKLDEVQSELLSNEVRRKSSKEEVEGRSEAFVARAHRKGKGIAGPCFFCKKGGHVKKDCEFRKQWLKNKEKGQSEEGSVGIAEDKDMPDNNVVGEVLLARGSRNNTSTEKDSWILDSGSSVHVCSNKGKFSSFVHKKEKVVRLANGTVCRVHGEGTVHIAGNDGAVHTLEEVQYAPKVCMNLISLGVLDQAGCEIQMHKGVITVSKESRVILHGKKCGGLYKLQENSSSGGVGEGSHRGGVHEQSLERSPKVTGTSRSDAGELELSSSAAGYRLRMINGGGFEVISVVA